MIIFLYGPDAYRLRQSEKKIISAYRAKHVSGLNLIFCDADSDSGLTDAENAVKSLSFFDEIKLIVVKNAFSHKTAGEKLESLAKSYGLIDDAKAVLLVSSFDSKPPAWLLGAKVTSRNFDYLKGVELEKWLAREFESRDRKVNQAVVRALIDQEGRDSWRLAMAVDAIANYVSGPVVSSDDVNKFKSRQLESNIFAFIDRLALGDRLGAFGLLYRELKSGQEPHYVLTMMAYQLRTLLMVKDAAQRTQSLSQMARATGLKPFVASKCLQVLSKVSLAGLKRSYQDLGRLEQASKRGALDIEDGLYCAALSFVA